MILNNLFFYGKSKIIIIIIEKIKFNYIFAYQFERIKNLLKKD